MTRLTLDLIDSHDDKAQFVRSETNGNVYVSVNDVIQVRLLKPQQQELIEFLTQETINVEAPVQEPDTGLFYLIRQRKDNPLKLKVVFANTSSAKMFTTRAAANDHKGRMDRQHGDKFKFFVVKEAK